MVVGLPQLTKQLPPISVSIFDKTISPVPFAKDLGVYLDQRLSYDTHITKTVSSCFNQLVHINRIKHVLDRPTLLLLIKRFVFTKLFYCSSVWANTFKANIHKLQLVQNFAARIILGLKKFDHISEGLKSLAIDLFGLYILFSQYRSCDNTQEAWSFVLFIKKSACRHIHACMPSF